MANSPLDSLTSDAASQLSASPSPEWSWVIAALAILLTLTALAALWQSRRKNSRLHQSLQEHVIREKELLRALGSAEGGMWELDLDQQTMQFHGDFFLRFDIRWGDGNTQMRSWLDLHSPADAKAIQEKMRHMDDRNQAPFEGTVRVRDHQGEWHWLLTRCSVTLRNTQARAVRIVGVSLDITRLHQTEQALRTSQAKYNTIYQALPDPAGIIRLRDGLFIEVNPAFCELIGLPRSQIIGQSAAQLKVLHSEEDRLKIKDIFSSQRCLTKLPVTAHTQSGEEVPGLLSGQEVILDEGQCMVFVFQDMRRQQKILSKLQASNSLLHHAGSMARLGVWESTPERGLIYWSEICYQIHGLPQNTPLPTDYLDQFVAEGSRELFRHALRRCVRTRQPWSEEVQIVRTDGRLIWVRALGEPVIESGHVVSMRGVIQDIDESKRAQQRLQQSEERFSRIFQLMPYPVGMVRCSDLHHIEVNEAWERLFGYSRTQSLTHNAVELGLIDENQHQVMAQWVQEHGFLDARELQMYSAHGDSLQVLHSIRPIELDGEPCWLFATQDITALKRGQEQLKERTALLSLTISAAALGLWDWDLESGLVTGDLRWHAMRGRHLEAEALAVLPAKPWDIAPEDRKLLEDALEHHLSKPQSLFDATWSVVSNSQGEHWIRNLGKVVAWDKDGQPLRMLGVSIDVTHQRLQEATLHQLAHHDALTGLPNRILLARKLNEAMSVARERGTLLGVAYLDLDGFKPVNDILGHEAGDKLLIQASGRLTRALRASDSVARLGGDEFVLLLPGLRHSNDCERALRNVMESISAPYIIDQSTANITASIGYTLYPQDESDADTLLRHADQAMYQAKQNGRNRFRQFDTASEKAAQQVQAQGQRLLEALAHNEFVLYLQPKVHMREGRIVGVEALARWQHPQEGLLPPAAFLPQLQGLELEMAFGAWVTRTALDILEQLRTANALVPISINISAPHLQQSHFAQWLGQQLAQHPQLDRGLLELEITETAALYHLGPVAHTLEQLRSLGVDTTLDDFGTGYSSLTYLRRLPLQALKIDQTFVRGMMTDAGDLAIVQGVIGLARSFGYKAVAEGVETIDHGRMLLQMGCHYAQGYGIARPMPVQDFIEWSTQWKAPAEWMDTH